MGLPVEERNLVFKVTILTSKENRRFCNRSRRDSTVVLSTVSDDSTATEDRNLIFVMPFRSESESVSSHICFFSYLLSKQNLSEQADLSVICISIRCSPLTLFCS